jgi:DNA polymerase bacteriophage-type
MALRLSGDFETFSTGSLPRIGAYRYARLETTLILCFAYAIDDGDPVVWYPLSAPPPADLIAAARNPKLEFRAWNAAFEFNIWNACGVAHGLPPLPIDVFHCTMAQALVWGVPAGLEQAAIVLKTNVEKDKVGARLMRKMMKPRAHKDGRITRWHEDQPHLIERLGEYCAQDVRSERSILRSLRPMPPAERRLWLLDQRMNHRGLKVDVDAVRAMQEVVNDEIERLGDAMSALTDGAITSPTQAGRLVNYLKKEGVKIDGVNKNVLPLLLQDDLIDRHRQILMLYREGAKSSTAKLRSMANYLNDDGRIRGLVQYGGAMRTLRWAGRGPQIQNYPRPSKEIDARAALKDILWGLEADEIEFVHGPPMTVISQCLRGAYVAAEGHAFAVCDYSGIEARVVAWLAGQDDALDIFRRDLDIYMKTAHDVGSNNRQLGKILTLACGFGMGPRRFRDSAAAPPYNIELTKDDAKTAVYGWRDANHHIRHLWYNVDEIVRMVIERHVADRWIWTDSKKVCFRMASDERLAGALLMKLPSDRVIVYRNARVEDIINDPDGAADVESVIRYDGLDWTKKWTRIRSWGGKFVENMTQAVARDLLRDALLQLDDDDEDLLTTIHDEIIAEPLASRADARLREMKAVMGESPSWAYGLPLKAEGGVMARYGK